MVDLNDIALFVKVVEVGSFTGAARALGIPKTTVSRKVAQLEANLGARLLQRTTRKLSLTEVGTLYFDRCSHVLGDIEEANLAVTAVQSIPSGTLRVTATEGFGNMILYDWLIEFLQKYERVNAEVLFSNSYIDLVTERIDVAFRFGAPDDSSLVSRRLGAIAYWVCASPDYFSSQGEPQLPKDLSQHSCIVVSGLSEPGKWRLNSSEGEEIISVSARVKVNSVLLAYRAALAGLGVACLPKYRVEEDIKAGRLIGVLEQWTPIVRDMYIIYPSDRYLSPKVRAFIDFVVEKVSYLLPWLV